MQPTIEARIVAANLALESFARTVTINREIDGVHVSWEQRGKRIDRRWQARGGQDFYPTWSRIYPGGGTSTTALSQLVRWVRGLPVLPISTWRYWSSETCKLLPRDAVDRLEADGYPADTPCVLCGGKIWAIDWWHLGGVSGPCCSFRTGCRQKVN